MQGHTVQAALFNARSVCNKAEKVHELIVDHNLKMLAVTETWLKDTDGSIVIDLCPPNYTMLQKCRPLNKGERGGGVGLILSNDITAKEVPGEERKTFEYIATKVMSKERLLLIVIYRPPTSRKNNFTLTAFLEEFEDFLAEMITRQERIILLGDFNIHWDDAENSGVKTFRSLIDTFQLKQHIDTPTHRDGHTLDLIMTSSSITPHVNSIEVQDIHLSDHYLVTFSLRTKKEAIPRIQKNSRKLKSISITSMSDTLQRNLMAIPDVCNSEEQLDSIVQQYSDAIVNALDAHAPMRTVTLKGDNNKAWYDDEVHAARRERRKLERKYRKSKLTIHKEMLEEQANEVVKLIKQKKSDYHKKLLLEADKKDTFRIVKTLVEPLKQMKKQDEQEDAARADEFRVFFEEKVKAIQQVLEGTQGNQECSSGEIDTVISDFQLCSTQKIGRLIENAPNKSCSLDPLPTWLLKDRHILEQLLPYITRIINWSIQLAYVPKSFKVANVRPTLKKPGADQDVLANFRPVSNLPFVSKVLERVIANEITVYLNENAINDPLQSAYRKEHSTETAILKVKSDMDAILDQGDGVLLVLLDLSSAFDTIDHGILLKRLEREIGIRGNALTWIKSYLEDRHQRVTIGNTASENSPLTTGVPQGSVLGPLLFSLYVLPLKEIITKHAIKRHHYADDTQLYTRLRIQNNHPDNMQEDIKRMEKCLQEIRSWMKKNMLKLNESKTELLIITTKSKKDKVADVTLKVGEDSIKASPCVRDLGSWLDDTLSMRTQVQNTVKAGYYHLRTIGRIRKNLDDDTCAKIINATVTSRQDYHNALLAGSYQCITEPLQRLQNNAARLLTGARRSEHITPVLSELHWLPIKERIDFKLLVMIHHALHNQDAPSYMKEMFQRYTPNRCTRATDDPWTIVINRTMRHEGDRCGMNIGATLWNSLPLDLRCAISTERFKKDLKTFLFNRAFTVV
jgi:hypothetical protein